MKLKIFLPTRVLLERKIEKIRAEAENGYFSLLPHHIDFVTALVPGVLSFETGGGKEEYVGLNGGILVKAGLTVSVSSPQAVYGPGLGDISGIIDREFREMDDQEKKSRAAAARLEADLVRRFMEVGHEST
jgi:F-type H+-transporting ATPase subunit epsilon